MILEKISFLKNVSDQAWGEYSFKRDPLKGKVSRELRQELIQKANDCGKQQAIKLKDSYPNLSIKEIVGKLKLELIYKDSDNSENYILFACYNSPNKISLFEKNISLTETFIQEEKLGDLLGNIEVESILISHELFHFIEENDEEIFPNKEKILLWKFLSYEHKSKLIALSEIAAMSFAKEMLSLDHNPFLYDVLMLYPHNQEKPNQLFKEIQEITKGVNQYD